MERSVGMSGWTEWKRARQQFSAMVVWYDDAIGFCLGECEMGRFVVMEYFNNGAPELQTLDCVDHVYAREKREEVSAGNGMLKSVLTGICVTVEGSVNGRDQAYSFRFSVEDEIGRATEFYGKCLDAVMSGADVRLTVGEWRTGKRGWTETFVEEAKRVMGSPAEDVVSDVLSAVAKRRPA